jgi:hypothetical protein
MHLVLVIDLNVGSIMPMGPFHFAPMVGQNGVFGGDFVCQNILDSWIFSYKLAMLYYSLYIKLHTHIYVYSLVVIGMVTMWSQS